MTDNDSATVKKDTAYTEAMSTFRHYDTLSAIAIGAIPATVVAVCTALHDLGPSSLRAGIPLAGALFVGVTFNLYLRLDLHAAVALKVASCLERGGQMDGTSIHGLASARENFAKLPSLNSKNKGAIYRWVLLLSISVMSSLLVLTGICIASRSQVL